jgi:hypothetical protein
MRNGSGLAHAPNGLLDVCSLNEGEFLLDLLQRPARTDETEQMFDGEPVTPDTRPASHLARLNRDPWTVSHVPQHSDHVPQHSDGS